MTYEIVPFSPVHVGPLVARLGSQRKSMEGFGNKARPWVRWLVGRSCQVEVALIEGRPVAMWGTLGTLASTEVSIWFLVADDIRDRKFAIARAAKRTIERILLTVDTITSVIVIGDPRARRFIEFLGFTIGEYPIYDAEDRAYFPCRRTRA